MNKHDSERITGVLMSYGMVPVDEPAQSDYTIFLTCCVREKADERLRGTVASLKSLKTGERPELIIAVGGCIGQRDGEKLMEQIPTIDVVFGTHNVHELPQLLAAARNSHAQQVSVLSEGTEFTTDLPAQREHEYHAWLPITVGCDNFCTYCIVPYVRGRERSRAFEDVVAEAQKLVDDGVKEITLLGQNVNSYGRDLYGEPRFAEVLRAVAATGIERLGFATSHPKDLTDDTIAALAAESACLDYLHLPVQSGSTRILKAMNRHYTAEEYRALVARIRKAIPDIALSTDIIVGFPGETDEDFTDTLDLVRDIGYDQAFTFIYSPREGTPAAEMSQQVARDTCQVRFDALIAAVQEGALRRNQARIGKNEEVLVEGVSKRDPLQGMGRTRQYKTVHFALPDAQGTWLHEHAGHTVNVHIDSAHTWYLSGTLKES